MKPLELKVENMPKINLKKEYQKALKDSVLVKIVSKLKMDEETLCGYTSMLEESAHEYHNCLACHSLNSCLNRVKGHVYMPINNEGNLSFEYKSCKFYNKYQKNNQYLNHIIY